MVRAQLPVLHRNPALGLILLTLVLLDPDFVSCPFYEKCPKRSKQPEEDHPEGRILAHQAR